MQGFYTLEAFKNPDKWLSTHFFREALRDRED